MKMKTFFLKHAVAVAAIAIASVSLMSFGLENNQTSQWYAVETDEQTIDYNSPMTRPGPTDECSTKVKPHLCAIEIFDNATPQSVQEAEDQNVAGEKAYKNL